MREELPLDMTLADALQKLQAWQDQQTPTLKQTERGVQALQPLIELLTQPEGQPSDAVSRLAELLSATLARLDRIGDELAATNSALTTLVSRQNSLKDQITAQGQMLKDLHDALVDD